VLRALLHRDWPLSLADLIGLVDGGEDLRRFLKERLIAYLRDAGYAPNEVQSVVRPRIDPEEVLDWALPDVVARLDAIKRIRGREDFLNLVKLTERVDTILQRNAQLRDEIAEGDPEEYAEGHGAAVDLARRVDEYTRELATLADDRCYPEIVESFASLVAPVEKFFQDVLVIDPTDPAATLWRYDLLSDLRGLLTRYFDIRELAGQAERR
jgi:glycyl-tRNA synthetase beta subunit